MDPQVKPDQIDGVKVFSATKHEERRHLGEKATQWIAEHPQYKITCTPLLSSDNEFHCLALVLTYTIKLGGSK